MERNLDAGEWKMWDMINVLLSGWVRWLVEDEVTLSVPRDHAEFDFDELLIES